MNADTMLVLVVGVLAVVLHPGAREGLHRLDIAWRFRRKYGYTWRAAWRLAEGR